MRLVFVLVTLAQSACSPTSHDQVNWDNYSSNQLANQSVVVADTD
jgi:hypothetical protein